MRNAIGMTMRKIIFFLLLFAITNRAVAQEDCGDAAIMSKTGSWKKHADANMRYDKNQANINRWLDSIGKLFQVAVPEPKGMEAAWYRSMNGPIFPGAPSAYTLNSMYLPWYCNTNLHKMLLSDETSTWAYVFVNSLDWFVSGQFDKASVQVDGATVYNRPLRKGEWKGIDLYQPSSHGPAASCILLTRGSRPILKPVTQEQYLHAWRTFVMNQKNETARLADGTNSGSNDAKLAKAVKYYDDKLQMIDNYLSHAGEEQLRQPAVIGPKDNGDFTGSFSTEEKGGRMLVTVDPAFFSRDLPAYVPQVMVLYWRWGKDAASQNFKKQFEENFPVERLAAMLDNPVKP
jgi:hypothetical protein